MKKTPQQKADWIAAKHLKLFQRLGTEAKSLVDSPAPRHGTGRRLIEIADELASKVAPVAACRRGCSHCCHQAVIVPEWEAQRIGRHIGRAPAQIDRGALGQMQEARDKFTRVPCTFLKDGECSVYEVRPMVCRTHLSLADDAEPCDTHKHPGARVPYFNFQPLVLAQALLHLSEAHADLREWFPPE